MSCFSGIRLMLDTALRDINKLPGSDKNNENSTTGNYGKPCNGTTIEGIAENQRTNPSVLVSTTVNGYGTVVPGVEMGNSEVEYVESKNLNDVEDVGGTVKALLSGLDSKDWVLVCESLNNVRRLSIFHKEAMVGMLFDVVALIVKSLKNPRSAVCKTAIMTSADLFSAYNDHIIDSLDPLLVQLLLKSSQDKKFVCEEAERTLVEMTTWVSPMLLLPKLQPYLKSRNPRIRAKASMCFFHSVQRLGAEGIKSYGIDKLIQIAVSHLSDQLPESREAARALLFELQTGYEKSLDLTAVSDNPELDSWEQFCQSKLSPINAQAVLRVTNIAREGLALGC